ncbi:MAG: hypothetical protein ACRCTY_01910 [Candidatus Adiutrix sp.]
MRCPKCGYNSFDYNLACPKCRRDLAAPRKLLSLNVPIPAPVDFFLLAANRAISPAPFIETDLRPEYVGESEAAIEEIFPIDFENSPPPPVSPGADTTYSPEKQPPVYPEQAYPEPLAPLEPAYPEPSGPAFHNHEATAIPGHLPTLSHDFAPPEDLPPPNYEPQQTATTFNPTPLEKDDEIEIELESAHMNLPIEPPPASPFMANPLVMETNLINNHTSVMAQIKNTLAETGDLSDPMTIEEVEIESIEAEIVPPPPPNIAENTTTSGNDVEAGADINQVEISPDLSQLLKPSEPEITSFGQTMVVPPPEPETSESELGELSSLADNLNLDELDQ